VLCAGEGLHKLSLYDSASGATISRGEVSPFSVSFVALSDHLRLLLLGMAGLPGARNAGCPSVPSRVLQVGFDASALASDEAGGVLAAAGGKSKGIVLLQPTVRAWAAPNTSSKSPNESDSHSAVIS
jgi:hypothetical protein